METAKEFFAWEKASRDTIDVKRCYIDLADDLVSGILLSQIVYWFIPGEKDQKLKIERDGCLWLAKGRSDWWAECRITEKQFDRAISVLKDAGLVETALFRFRGSPTLHIWLNISALLEGVKSILTKGEKPSYPEDKIHFDERLETLHTETTPKTTTEKHIFGEFENVALTVKEYDRLVARFGEKGAKERIEALSAGIESKGYKYKSHYAAILNWDRRDKKENGKDQRHSREVGANAIRESIGAPLH